MIVEFSLVGGRWRHRSFSPPAVSPPGLVAAKLQRTKTLPSPLTNDFEFVRRVYLDLTGLPPTPEQIQAFVGASPSPSPERGGG